MKKLFSTFTFILLLAVAAMAGNAKYVFYFIGDGMGVNHVHGTEAYFGSLAGHHPGTESLLFTTFPYAGVCTTYSESTNVTDSAAAGTALAGGKKTFNGRIGVDTTGTAVESIAAKAKKAGRAVGVTTTVGVDHATPAVFYAHQPDRNWYYEIALDIPKAGFDFHAGGGFHKPHTDKNGKEAPSIYPILEDAGYTIVGSADEYRAKKTSAGKMILTQGLDKGSDLPYAIDQKPGDLNLAQITECAIDFLTTGRNKNKGFFLMVEGGKIDGAGHGNDAATAFLETKDMDDAIKVAYEFYKKHPKETLIVVTADHETGGLSIGPEFYTTNLPVLRYQKCSQDVLSARISQLRKEKGRKATWEDARAILTENFGLFGPVYVRWEQEKTLRDEFEKTFHGRGVKMEDTWYASTEPLAAAAKRVLNQIAIVGWASANHTGAWVPVFAIGNGADLFTGKLDNTDIPKLISRAAGY